MFIKPLILYYFYLKNNIWIKINVFDYFIGGIPSQLIIKKGLISLIIYKFNGQPNCKSRSTSHY